MSSRSENSWRLRSEYRAISTAHFSNRSDGIEGGTRSAKDLGEGRRQPMQHLIGHRCDASQWMGRSHAGFGGYITERHLLEIHALRIGFPELVGCCAVILRIVLGETQGFFDSLNRVPTAEPFGRP